jgi:hypothetical protein
MRAIYSTSNCPPAPRLTLHQSLVSPLQHEAIRCTVYFCHCGTERSDIQMHPSVSSRMDTQNQPRISFCELINATGSVQPGLARKNDRAQYA